MRYPLGLPIGTTINNVANATIVPISGGPIGIGPGVRNDTIGGSLPAGTSSKSAPDVAPGAGNPIVYSINANTDNANVRVPNFTVVERFPQALAPLPPGITFARSAADAGLPADGAVSIDMRERSNIRLFGHCRQLLRFLRRTALATIRQPVASSPELPADLAVAAT